MTWNVNFEIKDGKVAPESVSVSGTAPAGLVNVYGHETDLGRSLTVSAGGATSSLSYMKPVAPKAEVAEVAEVVTPEVDEPPAPAAPPA
jgi:hypothetical protein